jgi:ribosomal protein S18 acetylase RimI-like enzyme
VEIRRATPADLDAAFDLLTRRSVAAFGSSELEHDQLVSVWQLEQTHRLVATDGGVVGYAALDAAHEMVIAAPDDELNDALLRAVEVRARARGFTTLVATVVPEDLPFHALVTRSGFTHHNDVLRMWRQLDGDLPQAVWPDGVAVRSYTGADGPAVHALLDGVYSAWDETYVPRPHEDWLQWMTKHDEFDPDLWFLVERDDALVACALHWKEHTGRGWVKDIVVQEGERGHGLGKALLHHGFAEYARRGVERVGLKVDAGNPTGAPQLYERVGFVIDRRYGTWVKRL